MIAKDSLPVMTFVFLDIDIGDKDVHETLSSRYEASLAFYKRSGEQVSSTVPRLATSICNGAKSLSMCNLSHSLA